MGGEAEEEAVGKEAGGKTTARRMTIADIRVEAEAVAVVEAGDTMTAMLRGEVADGGEALRAEAGPTEMTLSKEDITMVVEVEAVAAAGAEEAGEVRARSADLLLPAARHAVSQDALVTKALVCCCCCGRRRQQLSQQPVGAQLTRRWRRRRCPAGP